MSLFLSCSATVLLAPLPLMQRLHQLRNGRCAVTSFLFAWLSRIVFSRSLPFSKLFLLLLLSSVPLTTRVRHRPRPRCSSLILPFLLRSQFWSNSAGRLKARVLSFVARRISHLSSFSNPFGRPTAPQTRLSSCSLESSLASARVLDVRFPRSEHDDVSLAEMLTEASGLLTSASKNFILHFLPSRMNSSLASPSTLIGLPFTCRQPHRLRRLCSRNTLFRTPRRSLGGSRTNCDLHDLLRHVNCVDLFKVFSHFPKDQNCEVCLRTKMTRAPCRKRTGAAVPRAEKFRDLDG